MEKLDKYRQIVRQLLTSLAAIGYCESNENVECQFICDTENDHYQLLDIGWEEYNRIYNCFIHIDIKDGKIWIQENMTENDLAHELVEMGVNKEDIILGLHPPYKRPYTGYGVA
jgi:XisI protein